MLIRLGSLAVLLVIAAIFPLVITNALYTQFAVDTLIFVAAVVAWNIFSGFSGYISLGHAVFFGTGAYTVGLLTTHWKVIGGTIFALLPLGGLAAAVVAVPFGLIALRVRRHTFVVITIAIFFIFQLMAFNLSSPGVSRASARRSSCGARPTTTTRSTTSRSSSRWARSCWPG